MSILGGMLDSTIGLSVGPGRAVGLSAGPIVTKDGRGAVTEIVTPRRDVLCVAWVCAGCALGAHESHRASNGWESVGIGWFRYVKCRGVPRTRFGRGVEGI